MQDRKNLQAEDLAAIFEVSKRTIYRDIQALCEAGVPVVAVTGQGYSLLKGYFLPPVSFSPDEALLLILGSEVMSQNFDAQYRTVARSARRKIEAVLPEALREQVEALQNQISFVAAGQADSPISHDYLLQLRRAILEHRTVRLHYHQRFSEAGESPSSVREVDPQQLIHRANAWYLSAYCYLRQEIRHFRLDRIERLELLPQTFADSTSPVVDQPSSTIPRDLVIRALFDRTVARWLPEARSFYMVIEDKGTEWVIGHASRTLVKQGHKEALMLLGYSPTIALSLPRLQLNKTIIPMGEDLIFEFEIRSNSDEPQHLMIDYVIHHMKANGKLRPKVFKLAKKKLKAFETLRLSKKHSFRAINTRKYYAGQHLLEIQINGKVWSQIGFELK